MYFNKSKKSWNLAFHLIKHQAAQMLIALANSKNYEMET
jgi:hypothetical protein